jgi:hypothetical protein
MAKLSVEEPDALMHARPGPWEPWRVTARATQPDARNASAQPPGPPAETTTLESRTGGPGLLLRVVRWGGPTRKVPMDQSASKNFNRVADMCSSSP